MNIYLNQVNNYYQPAGDYNSFTGIGLKFCEDMKNRYVPRSPILHLAREMLLRLRLPDSPAQRISRYPKSPNGIPTKFREVRTLEAPAQTATASTKHLSRKLV